MALKVEVKFLFFMGVAPRAFLLYLKQICFFLFPSSLFLFNSGCLRSAIYDSFHERLGFL